MNKYSRKIYPTYIIVDLLKQDLYHREENCGVVDVCHFKISTSSYLDRDRFTVIDYEEPEFIFSGNLTIIKLPENTETDTIWIKNDTDEHEINLIEYSEYFLEESGKDSWTEELEEVKDIICPLHVSRYEEGQLNIAIFFDDPFFITDTTSS